MITMKHKVMCLLGLLVSAASGAPTYYLATGQSGAQTQIDVNHTSTWLFTPNVDFDFGGALVTMKAGQNTTANIVFQLFIGTDASGQEIVNTTMTSTQFCGQVSNCGTYEYHSFLPALPVSLSAGMTYFGSLTSTAPDTQSGAYFIKNNTYFISDINGNQIQPSPIGPLTPPSPTAVPEPGTSVLMALGCSVLALPALRKRLRS
jgi:hypothetical protein